MIIQSQVASPKHMYIWETLNKLTMHLYAHVYKTIIIKEEVMSLKENWGVWKELEGEEGRVEMM